MPSREVASSKSSRMRLASPPESNGRICYYGYDVTLEWLIGYSKTHYKNCEGHDDSGLIGAALYLLMAHSGIRTLAYHSAHINPTAPSDRSIEGDPPGVRMVPILSIFSSISYKKRPSQEKADALTKIMGREPMWWIGF